MPIFYYCFSTGKGPKISTALLKPPTTKPQMQSSEVIDNKDRDNDDDGDDDDDDDDGIDRSNFTTAPRDFSVRGEVFILITHLFLSKKSLTAVFPDHLSFPPATDSPTIVSQVNDKAGGDDSTAPVDQREHRNTNRDNRVLRVKEDHVTVRRVLVVSDVDILSQNWTVIQQGGRQLRLLFRIEELRDRVLDLVKGGQAAMTTFMKVDVEDCYHITKAADASESFLGFIVVDVEHDRLLCQDVLTLFDRDVFSCSVLLNDPVVVTPQHSDLDAGITFVLSGQKTFRVLTAGTKTKMGSKKLWPRTDSDPPLGWQDIVVDAGCAVFVPKGRPHCVLSSDSTIAISLTFKQALPKTRPSTNCVDGSFPDMFSPPSPTTSPPPSLGEAAATRDKASATPVEVSATHAETTATLAKASATFPVVLPGQTSNSALVCSPASNVRLTRSQVLQQKDSSISTSSKKLDKKRHDDASTRSEVQGTGAEAVPKRRRQLEAEPPSSLPEPNETDAKDLADLPQQEDSIAEEVY